jgi:hypothetical protein
VVEYNQEGDETFMIKDLGGDEEEDRRKKITKKR